MSHATLRTIHGVVALGLAGLLALYAVSGWLIIHRAGGGEPATLTSRVPIAALGDASEDAARVRAIAAAAAAFAGLSAGKPGAAKFENGAWHVSVARVARSAEVTLAPGAAEAEVVLRSSALGEGIKRLHRANANGASGWRLAWALAVDLLSVALLLFALTGVLLFLALKRDRRLGWLALGAGTLYTLASFVYLAVSR